MPKKTTYNCFENAPFEQKLYLRGKKFEFFKIIANKKKTAEL